VLCNVNWTRSLLAPTRAAGVRVVTDLHAVAGLDNPYDADYLDNADILFLSGEILPEPPERFAARILAGSSAEIVGMGLGEQGALIATRSADPIVVPAPALRPVVSTTGAGDALLAAFVHFHRRRMSPEEAMRRAVVFASWTVGARGASEGFLDESALEELLAGL
jgi:ribokinase